MRHALITAGATRNPIDAIRYVSAHATGRTGVEVARRLRDRHDVLLLGSGEACLRGPDLPCEEYTSTRDLMGRMERHARAHPDGVIVHSAAVGDYEAQAVATKIPSNQPELVIRMTPGPKILDHLRAWAPDCFLVSFKAASPEVGADELEAIARAQLRRTHSDLVFANRLGALQEVLLVGATHTERHTERGSAITALIAAIHA